MLSGGREEAVLQTQALGTTQMIQYVLTYNFNYERSVWVIMPWHLSQYR